MRRTLAIALLLTAPAVFAGEDKCDYEEPRSLSSSAAGLTKIVVYGVSGSLHVDGRAGVKDVIASGTACTSDKDLLRDITLTARRSGSELHVEAQVPEHSGFDFFYEARLDFGVVVPQGVAIEIRDGSGGTKVTNTGSTKIKDGSGELKIRNVHGDLSINDGSGEIEIDGVTGNVDIDDGSGEITVENVDGNVDIDDASGSINIAHVKRNVTVGDDGSGGVHATDVGGDFTVRSKGSGGVEYSRVSGRVSVPRDRD